MTTTTTEQPTIWVCDSCLRTEAHDACCGYGAISHWGRMSRSALRLVREDRIGSLELHLERYGDHGWAWTWGDEQPEHCTNGSGEGLFVRDTDGLHQTEGTGQYRLPRDEQAARRQLRRERLNSLAF